MICGLKFSHDGAAAVISDAQLLACIEVEKLRGNRRHARLDAMSPLVEELERVGIDAQGIRYVAIDGWRRIGREDPTFKIRDVESQRGHAVTVAGYSDVDDDPAIGPFAARTGALPWPATGTPFRSYLHSTGHIFASYCTSPFAAANSPALVLVWDGGMPACLYSVDPIGASLTRHGVVLNISGSLYPVFAAQFAPFRIDDRNPEFLAQDEEQLFEHYLPISGKAMALAGYGEPDEELVRLFARMTDALAPTNLKRAVAWSRRAAHHAEKLAAPIPVVLASFQEYLYRSLFSGLEAALESLPRQSALCLSGGCALNIKWNARLRSSGLFSDVWVPPFPNDAGSAIGTACAEMVARTGNAQLEWSVFSGPLIGPAVPIAGWSSRPCTIEDVGALLHMSGEPILVLSGRAELGPRALGHRSILAPAKSGVMRDKLNSIKSRESYRPVAPICLAHRAHEIFSPGTVDPFMVFDHAVRPRWRDRIPAVTHADGSARLQTVGQDNELMFRALNAYEAASGVPVLCNTSANLPGRGFFADASSAMRWAQVPRIWCDGVLLEAV